MPGRTINASDSAPFEPKWGISEELWNSTDRRPWLDLQKNDKPAQKQWEAYWKTTEVDEMEENELAVYISYRHFRHFKVKSEQKNRAERKRAKAEEEGEQGEEGEPEPEPAPPPPRKAAKSAKPVKPVKQRKVHVEPEPESDSDDGDALEALAAKHAEELLALRTEHAVEINQRADEYDCVVKKHNAKCVRIRESKARTQELEGHLEAVVVATFAMCSNNPASKTWTAWRTKVLQVCPALEERLAAATATPAPPTPPPMPVLTSPPPPPARDKKSKKRAAPEPEPEPKRAKGKGKAAAPAPAPEPEQDSADEQGEEKAASQTIPLQSIVRYKLGGATERGRVVGIRSANEIQLVKLDGTSTTGHRFTVPRKAISHLESVVDDSDDDEQ